MEIIKATLEHSRTIAELAMMAGEGIPSYFWEQDRKPGQDLLDVGAHNACSEDENFSYRNTRLALVDGRVAGMLLAYRLPDADDAEDLDDFPMFIRPLIELEQCVPGSYYINMLAAYPQYRGQGIGSELMGLVGALATEAGSTLTSVEVFEQNTGALKLYRRLGYEAIDQRDVVPHPCHPYTGQILLLAREVRSS